MNHWVRITNTRTHHKHAQVFITTRQHMPPLTTTTDYHNSPPPLPPCTSTTTTTMHHHYAPPPCTTTMHHHYAPQLCTTTMHLIIFSNNSTSHILAVLATWCHLPPALLPQQHPTCRTNVDVLSKLIFWSRR